MNAKRTRRVRLGPVSRFFVEAVKKIPEVQLVILHYGDEPRIWTIIDAPPFERIVSNKIFDLEIEAYSKGDDGFGFRLINIQELPDGIAGLHIDGMPVLFQREQQTA